MEIIEIDKLPYGKKYRGFVACANPDVAAMEFLDLYGYMPDKAYVRKSRATGRTTVYFEEGQVT